MGLKIAPGAVDSGLKTVYNAGVETTVEYLEKEQVKKRVPKVKLVINPFLMPFVPVEFLSSDVDGLITACAYSKTRNQPGGQWNISFAADEERFRKLVSYYSSTIKDIWDFAGVSMRDLFLPMTYCQLMIDGYHVMTGYLTSFRKQTSVSSKMYIAQFDELGNIYHKNVLDLFTIVHGTEQVVVNDPTKFLYNSAGTYAGIPIDVAIRAYLNDYINSNLNFGVKGFPTTYWRSSEGFPMSMRLIAQPPPLGAISRTSLIASAVGDIDLLRTTQGTSFWDTIKGMISEDFCEFFTESGGRTICVGRQVGSGSGGATISAIASSLGTFVPLSNISLLMPGFSYVVLRTLPYDNPMIGTSGWAPSLYPFTLSVFDLLLAGDFVIITDEDVVQKDLGVSEQQQYTAFRAMETAGGASMDVSKIMNKPYMTSGPINPLNPGGMRTYGVRVKEGHISYNSSWQSIAQQLTDQNGLGTRFGIPFFKPSVHALSTLMASWYRNAANFQEGTIVTRAIPYARPGMMLLYLPPLSGRKPDDIRELGMYYIDNVQYQYQYGSAPQTTMTVIRGTPLPFSVQETVRFLQRWEIAPTGLNLVDGEVN